MKISEKFFILLYFRDFDVVARKNILKILYLLNLESGEQDMTQFPSF